MSQRMRLLCDANPMAYGSSSALLSILDHLGEVADATALVRDVSGELLGRDPAVARTLAVDVKDPAAVEEALASERFDAVLVVSNLSNVALYHRLGLPIFFVDILYWYGADKSHPVFRLAERSYAQAFPGVRERSAHYPPAERPAVVGPLIRATPPRASTPRGTLVNLGGVRSRFITPEQAPMFLKCVADLLHAVAPLLPPGPIRVAAGRDACALIAPLLPARAQAESLPQPAYLRALAEAAVFLSAPGLNAVFEALEVGVPLVFLPPQNATQVLQLERYERASLAAPGLNLPALVPTLSLPPQVADEGAYTAQVLDALRAVVTSDDRTAALVAHVTAQLHELAGRGAARQAFWAGLGPPGGPRVAADLARFWEARAR